MMKRLLAVWLCVMILMAAVPVRASEADVLVMTDAVQTETPDTTDLFAGYTERQFLDEPVMLYRIAAADVLTGNEKLLYDGLATLVREIAAGKRSSTVLSVGRQVTDRTGKVYPADVNVTFPNAEFADDALDRVISALLTDMPYEMYWYDKVSGCKMLCFYTSSAIMNITISFTPADTYQGSGEYTVDPGKTGAPAKAAAAARKIVDAYASSSDYEKLEGYKQEICAMTEYDYDAMELDFGEHIDPWQIIYVFDGDENTKAVCEGYSKAYQYLCQMSSFSRDISCNTVEGYSDGGNHMWNIVTIEGKNYLVDVTNEDDSWMAGDLFLAGTQGSISEGYRLRGIWYTYDPVAVTLWGTGADSILHLADTYYRPGQSVCDHETVLENSQAPGCVTPGYSGDERCLLCAEVVRKGQQIPATGHSWDAKGSCAVCGETQGAIHRIYGATRYQTAFYTADTLKELLAVSKFESIIVTCGTNFPDALAGTYLAAQKQAPILLVNSGNVKAVNTYIRDNLAPGGTVYLLGDNGVVPDSVGQGIGGITVKRLGGATRYDTNLEILREAGVEGKRIIVCTGKDFADSLSASACGLPILLVKDGLTARQKDFLSGVTEDIIIVGGTNAVNTTVEKQLRAYGTVTRLAGTTRYQTSVAVAAHFFHEPTAAVLAYAQNFPDGLCGGPLAYYLGAPMILTSTGHEASAVSYTAKLNIRSGYVLGGTGLISDRTAEKIFSVSK